MRSGSLVIGLVLALVFALPAFADEPDAGTPAATAAATEAGSEADAGTAALPAPIEPVPEPVAAPAEVAPSVVSSGNPPTVAPPLDAPSAPPAVPADPTVPAAAEGAAQAPADPAPIASEEASEAPAAVAPTAPEETKPPHLAPVVSEPTPAAPKRAPSPTPAKLSPRAPYSNELGLEVGWNAPSGLGVRYLHHLANTSWSLGGGLALTLWGPKIAILGRYAASYESGSFFQASLGFSSASLGRTQAVVAESGEIVEATFDMTAGRSLDLVYGNRWLSGPAFIEILAGWSFNLRGTALQVGPRPVRLDPAQRELLDLRTPGGLSLGLAVGRLF